VSASTFLVTLICVAVALSAGMTLAWLVWRSTRNSGWVDTVWTFSVGAVGVLAAIIPATGTAANGTRRIMVAAFAAAWALRLGLHIATRTRGITDDPRYAKLLQGWGADASQQMFMLLQKQALVSIPLGLAMVLAASNPEPALRLQDWLAVLVMAIAVLGEATADRQLRRFAANPANRGKVCDVGLWRWSRHPNYFFEWFGWLAYPLLAIGAWPWGWFALAAPACMYWLLVRVSGIPPLEEHMLATRGDAYAAYQARTSAFFPRPPRHHSRTN
jgi:steroid 5-alpha reductase family enzyme